MNFEKAVNTLLSATDRETRDGASVWLEHFEKSEESWSIVTQVIMDGTVGQEARMFGAQVLRKKVERELYKLDQDQQLRLKNLVLNMLQMDQQPKIVTQLCLALAELAIHGEWDSVEEMSRLFGEKFPIFLQFMTVLPEQILRSEEMFSKEEYVVIFNRILVSNGSQYFRLLCNYFQDKALRQKLMECLEVWVVANAIPLEVVVQSQLMELSFEALFDSSFQNAVQILESMFEVGTQSLVVIKQSLLERSMQNLHFLEKLLATALVDEDCAKGMCKLVASMSRCFMNEMLMEPQKFIRVYELMIQTTSFPFYSIQEPMFEVWELLAQSILEFGDFAVVFENLWRCLLKNLEYPNHQMNQKEQDEFRDYRHEVGQVLKHCMRITGPDQMLSKLGASLGSKWQSCEAILFALRTTAMVIKSDEPKVKEIMHKLPQLMESGNEKILYSIILLIGAFPHWTKMNLEFIDTQMKFISMGFSIESCQSASAKALKYLGEDCSNALNPYLNQLLPFYAQNPLGSDFLIVTEAIAHIINSCQPNQVSMILKHFMERHCYNLTQKLQIKDTLNHIAMFFKYLDVDYNPNPVLEHLDNIWDLILELLKTHATDDNVTEGICRVLRNTLRHNSTVKAYSPPQLQRLLELLGNMFEQTYFSCWIWVCGHVIDRFCTNSVVVPLLVHVVQKLTQVTIKQVEKEGLDLAFESIDELFGVLATMLHVLPDQIITWSMLPNILKLAVHSLRLDYPGTLGSVLYFINNIRRLKNDLISQTLFQIAPNLIKDIIYRHIVDRAFPHESHKDIIEILLDLSLHQMFSSWISDTLVVLPPFFNQSEANSIVAEFTRAARERSYNRFCDVLEKLSRLYSRRCGL